MYVRSCEPCKSIKFEKSTEKSIWIALPTQFKLLNPHVEESTWGSRENLSVCRPLGQAFFTRIEKNAVETPSN
jgi:hypothetical protein